MIFKVAFDTGRIKRFKLTHPPTEPFVGFRVIIEEEGNTGIIVEVQQGEEGKIPTHRYPDKLPLILPEHINVIKELAEFYCIPYVTLLFQFIPSHFIWYRDFFLYPKREAGIDRHTKDIVNHIKDRKRYTYDSAVKRFGKKVIDELIEKGVLEKKEEWVSKEKFTKFIKLKKNLKDALNEVKSKRAKLLLIHIAGEGIEEEKDLILKGFSKKIINSLLKKGLIEYTKIEGSNETPAVKVGQKHGKKVKHKDSFILWGDFGYIKSFLLSKREEIESSILIISTYASLLESFKDKQAITFSSRDNFETIYEKWFSVYKGNKTVIGTFNTAMVPLRDVSLITVLDDTLPSVKLPKKPYIDIRNICFLLSKEFKCSFYIVSPVISVESFYLLKRKVIHLDIKMLGDQKTHIIKRHPKEIINKEIIPLFSDKDSSKLIVTHKKGYSYMYCEVCQMIAQCPKCERFLTYFRSKGITLCTSCGFNISQNICPNCYRKLKETGIGIEKVMEVIEERFGIREDIHFTTFPSWHIKYDYVIVIDADNILSVPDYKSDEQFYNLLWRCLTASRKATLIQTLFPENAAVASVNRKDPYIFLEEELKRRKEFNLPPFTRMITALFSDYRSVHIFRKNIQEDVINVRSTKTSKGIKVIINIDRKHKEIFKRILSLLRTEFRKFVKDIKID